MPKKKKNFLIKKRTKKKNFLIKKKNLVCTGISKKKNFLIKKENFLIKKKNLLTVFQKKRKEKEKNFLPSSMPSSILISHKMIFYANNGTTNLNLRHL